jgi:hypothetical protein
VGEVQTGSVAPTSSTNAAAPSTFKVGDIVHVDTWQIAVLTVQNPYVIKQPPANSYGIRPPVFGWPPKTGEHYVAVDLQVTNTAKMPQSFLPLADLEDPAGHQYPSTILLQNELESPSGGLDPGKTISGPLYFSVPDGASNLTFTYWPSPLTKKARIALG